MDRKILWSELWKAEPPQIKLLIHIYDVLPVQPILLELVKNSSMPAELEERIPGEYSKLLLKGPGRGTLSLAQQC